jgi:hypothetical protein
VMSLSLWTEACGKHPGWSEPAGMGCKPAILG